MRSQLHAHTSPQVCVSVSVGQCVREIIRDASAGRKKVKGNGLFHTVVHGLYQSFLDKPL